jgi:hypothetical protein
VKRSNERSEIIAPGGNLGLPKVFQAKVRCANFCLKVYSRAKYTSQNKFGTKKLMKKKCFQNTAISFAWFNSYSDNLPFSSISKGI